VDSALLGIMLALAVVTSAAFRMPSLSPSLHPSAGRRLGTTLRLSLAGERTESVKALGGDEASLMRDPRGFCAERAAQADGGLFKTAAFDGAVFVGSAEALVCLADNADACEPASSGLSAPFARAKAEGDLFEAYAEAFNAACYQEIFLWIPRYKEAGFSTFRFEDYIDGRIRRLMPSMRKLLLRAASPALFDGLSFEEAAAAFGFDTPTAFAKAYQEYAVSQLPPKFTLAMPSLFDLDSKGDKGALVDGVTRWAGSRAQGEAVLDDMTSSIEQTTALVCNLMAAAHFHPATIAAVSDEQVRELKGSAPDAAISAELLSRMPRLDAFVRETMRLYPPARPGRARLTRSLTLPLSRAVDAGRITELSAGTVVAPEPFVAHFTPATFAQPDAFDPTRHLDGDAAAATAPLIPFAGPIGLAMLHRGAGDDASAGSQLAVCMAKAVVVQMSRMFEEVRIAASPEPRPDGYRLHTIGERVEVLAKPKMYYELQRGVKKLRF